MAKGNVQGSGWVSSQTNTSTTISVSGSYKFGPWYQYGVRVRCYINGSQVATNAGYTTGTYQTTASCSGSLTLSRGHSAYNVGWQVTSESETVSGYGGLGESDSTSGTITIPARPSYSVQYNANGGSGAPSSQTKWYDETLTLSSTTPTRTNYEFLGWATSSSATSATYKAGASYTSNSAVTLYAVWKLKYIGPTISNVTAIRCDAEGTGSDREPYGKVTVDWSVDTTISSSNTVKSLTVQYKQTDSTTWSTANLAATPSGSKGTTSTVVIPDISIEYQYDIKVTLVDTYGTSISSSLATVTATSYISKSFITMDFLAGGHGIAFGQPSAVEGFVSAMSADFLNELTKDGNTVHGAKILYDNSSGTNGTITLSDDIENYEYFDVFYTKKEGDWLLGHTRVYTDYSIKQFSMTFYKWASGAMYQIIGGAAKWSGNTITRMSDDIYINLNGSDGSVSGGKEGSYVIYIYRVVGYK